MKLEQLIFHIVTNTELIFEFDVNSVNTRELNDPMFSVKDPKKTTTDKGPQKTSDGNNPNKWPKDQLGVMTTAASVVLKTIGVERSAFNIEITPKRVTNIVKESDSVIEFKGGPSSGLTYALFGYYVLDYESKSGSNYNVEELESPTYIFSTGELSAGGFVNSIKDIKEKINSVLQYIDDKDIQKAIFLYPEVNEKEIENDDQFKADINKKLKLKPISQFHHALHELDIDKEKKTRPIKLFLGLASFDYEERDMFKGREELITKTLEKIKFNPNHKNGSVLLLDGSNGSGKSSLAKAGLLPNIIENPTSYFGEKTNKVVTPTYQNTNKSTGVLSLEGKSLGFVTQLYEFLVNKELISKESFPQESIIENSELFKKHLSNCLNDKSGTAIVFILDQLEEVFFWPESESELLFELLDTLTEVYPNTLIIATVRTEYLSKFSVGFTYKFRKNAQSMPVNGKLNVTQVKAIIHGLLTSAMLEPIAKHTDQTKAQGGRYYETNIINGIENIVDGVVDFVGGVVDDALGENNPLPLIQYGLTYLYELAEKRRDKSLCLLWEDYVGSEYIKTSIVADKVGLGLIRDKAESILETAISSAGINKVSEADKQTLATDFFMAFVKKAEEFEQLTKHRITKKELDDVQIRQNNISKKRGKSFENLINGLLESHLLVMGLSDGENTYQIAHDALLNKWPRVRSWFNEGKAYIIWEFRADQQYSNWKDSGKREWLLKGDLLKSGVVFLKDKKLHFKEFEDYVKKSQMKQRIKLYSILTVVSAALFTLATMYLEIERQLIEANHNFGLALTERAKQSVIERNFIKSAHYQSEAINNLKSGVVESRTRLNYLTSIRKNSAVWSSVAQNHHEHLVSSIDYSPDGQTLVSGSYDDSIKLWDVASGQLLNTLNVNSAVTSVAFSPKERILVSGSDDNVVRIWNLTSDTSLELNGHKNSVTSVAFSLDGQVVVSGSEDEELRLWSVETGKAVMLNGKELVLNGHTEAVTSVAFSPVRGRQILASGSEDKTVRLWDVSTGKPLEFNGVPLVLNAHAETVTSVAFSHDGRVLASASDDETLRLWNAATGEPLLFKGAPLVLEHSGKLTSLAFSPVEQALVSSSDDGTILRWDATTGKLLDFYTQTSHATSVAFSPDGLAFATGSEDRTLRQWDVIPEEKLAPKGEVIDLKGHTDSVDNVVVLPGGRSVVTSSSDGSIRMWDLATGDSQVINRFPYYASSIDLSPDGRILVSSSYDGVIRLWDLATKEALELPDHTGIVTSVAFSPDGKLLVSGSEDETLRLWDVATKMSRVLNDDTGTVTSVAFSPDMLVVVTGSEDETLRLWNLETGKAVMLNGKELVLNGHTEIVTSVAFSPVRGRQILASGSEDKTVRLWDVTTGEPLEFNGVPLVLNGHTETVTSVVFSKDGRFVASGSEDETLRLWDAATGEAIAEIEGHDGGVTSVDFAHDGQTLVSGSNDGTMRFWSVDTGKPIFTHEEKFLFASSVALAPNGRTVAYGSSDFNVRLLDLHTNQPLLPLKNGYRAFTAKVAFGPYGKTLVSSAGAIENGSMCLWSIDTGVCLPLEGHTMYVHSIAFSQADGKALVSGSYDDTILLWDLVTRKSKQFIGNTKGVTSIDFSPNGQVVVSGSEDGSLRLWDVFTREPLEYNGAPLKLKGHTKAVTSVAFSPDGKIIVSGSMDGTLRLWDVITRKPIVFNGEPLVLNGHTERVTSVTFSPDGKTIVSGSEDETVRFWDLTTGQPFAELGGHTGGVGSVVFSPDGQTLTSSSWGGAIRQWRFQGMNLATVPTFLKQWMAAQKEVISYERDGLDLELRENETRPNLYGKKTIKPFWLPGHPLYSD